MSDPVDELAPQACVSCREKKRKCSREVPVCSLCRRNRRPCHYPPKTATSFAESSENYVRQVCLSNLFPNKNIDKTGEMTREEIKREKELADLGLEDLLTLS